MTLSQFFSTYPRVIVACSGGIDSSYLLYEALHLAKEVKAVFVHTPFQPEFERQDAVSICKLLNIELQILELNVLENENIIQNPPNRCYYCKNAIFKKIIHETESSKFDAIIDGTNADDDAGDRPGMKALKELGILSPLRICGISKAMIRNAAQKAGIPIWNKPAYACLATRVASGECITTQKLCAIEYAEKLLKDMGFEDIRVRNKGNSAKIQIHSDDFIRFIQNRKIIVQALLNHFDDVTLDLKARDHE